MAIDETPIANTFQKLDETLPTTYDSRVWNHFYENVRNEVSEMVDG